MKKILSNVLIFTLFFTFVGKSFAEELDIECSWQDCSYEYIELEENVNELKYIPEEFFDSSNPYTIQNTSGGLLTIQPIDNHGYQANAVAGTVAVYWIPGIGQVALLVTGGIVVAGVTYWAGSTIYKKVRAYLAEKAYADAKKGGTKTSEHSTQSTSTSSSLPTKGKALSSKDLKDSQGVKQRRYYDKNGNADMDIDYRHGGSGHVFPHRHNWVNGKRGSAY